MPTDADRPTGTVTSPDGTSIAYWRTDAAGANGRPLLLVHGTTSDHTTWNELVPPAAAERVVYSYDRRGRGHSDDGEAGSAYHLDREAADAAAVIETVATREDGDVDVLAHSFGAFVALAALPSASNHVHALAAYSPGFGAAYPPGALERVDAAVGSGDSDAALQAILHDLIGMPDDEVAYMRSSPVWEVRKQLAWTVPRECRADAVFLDENQALLQQLDTAVLVISGATNTPDKRAIATRLAELVPDAKLIDLRGEGHAAHHRAPAALLRTALDYFERAD